MGNFLIIILIDPEVVGGEVVLLVVAGAVDALSVVDDAIQRSVILLEVLVFVFGADLCKCFLLATVIVIIILQRLF